MRHSTYFLMLEWMFAVSAIVSSFLPEALIVSLSLLLSTFLSGGFGVFHRFSKNDRILNT